MESVSQRSPFIVRIIQQSLGTLVVVSTGGLKQPGWSPCTSPRAEISTTSATILQALYDQPHLRSPGIVGKRDPAGLTQPQFKQTVGTCTCVNPEKHVAFVMLSDVLFPYNPSMP